MQDVCTPGVIYYSASCWSSLGTAVTKQLWIWFLSFRLIMYDTGNLIKLSYTDTALARQNSSELES